MSRSYQAVTGPGTGAFPHSPTLIVLAIFFLVAGLAAWSAGISGPYQFDDRVTPLDDPASQSLAGWRANLSGTLRPATKLSYALESQAGLADQPAKRRVASLLLQLCAAGLLFALMRQLEPRLAGVSAGLLVLIWFLHPVHADSILLISGRTALLSTVFLLAALLAMERGRPLLSAALFVLACLARETALAGLLPVAVLAATRPGLTWKYSLRRLAPVLAGVLVVLCWLVLTPRYLALAEFSFLGRPFWHSVFSQVGAVPAGFGLLMWPSGLSIDYGIELPGRAGDPAFLGGLACYALALAGIAWFWRRSRLTAIGLAVWLAALLPTQSVIPKLDPLSNRPLSLALAGLLLIMAALLAAALDRIREAPEASRRIPDAGGSTRLAFHAINCGLLFVILMLTQSTAQRSALFRSELDLWRDAAGKSAHNARPHLQYAVLLKQQGRDLEAWQAVSTAQSIDPFSSRIASLSRAFRPDEVKP